MRSKTGREIRKENTGLRYVENSKTTLKYIKYSVSRFQVALKGHRHKYKYHKSRSIGMNDRASGEITAAIISAIATYIFRTMVIPRLLRLIIFPIWVPLPAQEPFR